MKNFMLIIVIQVLFSYMYSDGIQPQGQGNSSQPYEIETLDNLLWVSTNSSCWNCHFIQVSDIDAFSTRNWNQGKGFSSIGSDENNYFQGFYNGNGFVIENLYINRTFDGDFYWNIGLFGYINGAVIENVSLKNVDISGDHDIGGFVGLAINSSIIRNCFCSGEIYGWSAVGGIAGCQFGNSQIVNCYSTAQITGNNILGGIVGFDQNSQTIDSFWDVDVSGISTSSGGTGKSTVEMKTISTFTDTSTPGLSSPWDFLNNPYNDTSDNDIWHIDPIINDGYPYICLQDTVTVSVCDFSVSSNLCWVDSTVHFQNLSIGSYIQYVWDFENDGIIDSYDTNPQTIYQIAGTYDVRLTAETISDETIKLKENFITALEFSPSQSVITMESYDDIEFSIYGGGDNSEITYQWYINGIAQSATADTFTFSYNDNSTFEVECAIYLDDSHLSKTWIVESTIENNENDVYYANDITVNIAPNPFNPSTVISFDLVSSCNIILSVYNLKGQIVKRLHEGELSEGKHSINWNGKDENNRVASSGIYYIMLKRAGEKQIVKKCILLK